jgi:hypothetical protein
MTAPPASAATATLDGGLGRRRFGSVSGAILKVLEQNGGDMSTKAIREQVEGLLGGTVSRFSVSDFFIEPVERRQASV